MTDIATSGDDPPSAERDHKLIEDYQNSDDFEERLKIARQQRSIILAERAHLRELAERQSGKSAQDSKLGPAQQAAPASGPKITDIARDYADFNEAATLTSPEFASGQMDQRSAQSDALALPSSDAALISTPPAFDASPAEPADLTAPFRSVEAAETQPISRQDPARIQDEVPLDHDRNFAPVGAPSPAPTSWPSEPAIPEGARPAQVDRDAVGVTGSGRSVAVGLAIGLTAGLAAGVLILPYLNFDQAKPGQPAMIGEIASFPPDRPPVETMGLVGGAGRDIGVADVIQRSDVPNMRATPPVLINLDPGMDLNAAQDRLTAPDVQVRGPSQTTLGLFAQEPLALPLRTTDPDIEPVRSMLQAPSDHDRAPTAPTLPSRVLAADQAAPQNLPVGPFDPAIMPRMQPAFSAAGMQSGARLVARPLPDQAPALPGLAPIPAADSYLVNLHVKPRSSGGDVVAQLRDLGLTNTTSVVHDLAMGQTTIAYYHARDAAAAQQMATLLNGEIMDMTGLQPAPRVGTVDIYLKD